MKKIVSILLLILLLANLHSQELLSHPDAELFYEKRKNTPLNEKERLIVGKWSGKNKSAEWEMLRKEEGTYELIRKEIVEGQTYVDYYRGIWSVRDGIFIILDLESSVGEHQFGANPSFGIITSLSKDKVSTVFQDPDGHALISEEVSIDVFRYEIWKELTR